MSEGGIYIIYITMKITTFNVNSVRTRLPILIKWLNECEPDLLFMQETKTQDEFFPEIAFSELGYKSFFHGGKSYNGVAILAKNNLDVKISFGFNDSDSESGANNFDTRILTLTYKNLFILNSYVPQGKSIDHPDFNVKKNFFARIRNIINREISKPDNLFLWLGDLNVAPEKIDVTHPEAKKNHVCFCDEIREIFKNTCAGLVDVLRLFHKESNIYTFYDYRVKDALTKKIGWRIDHMLASKNLADLAINCEPDPRVRAWERPSDHVPLTAEYNY